MSIQDISTHPARQSLTYRVYGPDATPDGFQALALEWDSLLAQCRFNSFFLTHAWQTTWWHYLGHGELWIIAFYSETDHQLVGIKRGKRSKRSRRRKIALSTN